MGDINDLRRARKAAAEDMQAKADALTSIEDQESADDAALQGAQAAFDAAKAAFECFFNLAGNLGDRKLWRVLARRGIIKEVGHGNFRLRFDL